MATDLLQLAAEVTTCVGCSARRKGEYGKTSGCVVGGDGAGGGGGQPVSRRSGTHLHTRVQLSTAWNLRPSAHPPPVDGVQHERIQQTHRLSCRYTATARPLQQLMQGQTAWGDGKCRLEYETKQHWAGK